MGRRRSRHEEPGLFDLPLDGPEPAGGFDGDREEVSTGAAGLDEPAPEPDPGPPEDPGPSPAAPGPAREAPALSARYLAGLADLAVHVALGVVLLYGARWLGADAGLADWPALVPVLAVFSFLYSVLTLAFWGQTPGMAWAGLVARASGDRSLTFGQTTRRWLGGLLTAALLGLPTLPAAGGGRSLADRLSDSDVRTA